MTMLNSPLSWGLGIFAGMAVYASGIADVVRKHIEAFVEQAAILGNAGNIWMQVALGGLAAFIAAVMLAR